MPKIKQTKTKSLADASWGGSGSTARSAESVRNLVRSLSPIQAWELSADIRTAINARARPLSQARIRLFLRRSGSEIVGGPLYDLLQNPHAGLTAAGLLHELSTWADLAGEMAVLAREENGRPVLRVLNPFSGLLPLPANPTFIEEVTAWQYVWSSGRSETLPADRVCFQASFNPASSVRGTSPVLAVVNAVSASYQALRYIKSFFANNACPSLMISLPEGLSPDEIKAFKREFQLAHSTYEGQAWKAMFVSGSTVKIDPLDQKFEPDKLAGILATAKAQVMALLAVPPLHSGTWDAAKFDSVDAQNEYFYESALLPKSLEIQGFLQKLIRQCFPGGDPKAVTDSKPQLGKALAKSLAKARAGATDDIVVVLDLDHVPVVARLKQAKVKYARELQQTFRMTPAQSAEEVGLDIDTTPLSHMVWHASTEAYVDPQAVAPSAAPDAEGGEDDVPAEPAEKTLTPDQRQLLGKAVAFYRELRKTTLEGLAAGEIYSLEAADALLARAVGEHPGLRRALREDRHALKQLLAPLTDAEARKAAVRKFFNAKKPATLKALLTE